MSWRVGGADYVRLKVDNSKAFVIFLGTIYLRKPKLHENKSLQWKRKLYEFLNIVFARPSAAGDIYGRQRSKNYSFCYECLTVKNL